MKYKELPTQQYLKECFDYDEETGILTWSINRPAYHFNGKIPKIMYFNNRAGNVVGNHTYKGYLTTGLYGSSFLLHRIIWKLVTGVEPNHEIDHINGIRDDNRFSNLRLATPNENSHNCKISSLNRSGYKGVGFHKSSGMWRARINIHNKQIHLGLFNTPELAYSAYCEASVKYHKEFGRVK